MAFVTAEYRNQVQIIRYANPPTGFMSSAGANEMLTAVKTAIIDPGVRSVVITGEGDVFVRHYDLSELLQVADALKKGLITARQFDHAPFVDVTDQIAAAPKPFIAAINGVCMGGGLELALACDIRIAGESVTQIGLPEVRVGIFPGGGGTQRLPRVVGEARALDIILNGRIFDAAEAKTMGLVHSVARDPVAAAVAMAEEMAARPAAGMAAAKKLVRSSLDSELNAGLIQERRAFADLLKADEAALEHMRRMVADEAHLGQAR